MKTIIVEVDTSGACEVTTQGFKGKACLDATRDIERALGTVTDEKKTAEFFMAPAGGYVAGQNGG